jgi:hypothetical protein
MSRNSVYILWWVPYDADYKCYEGFDFDDRSLIGVYSSRTQAESSIERSKVLPGFRMHPESFHIDEYEIDKDHWTSGFALESSDGTVES